MIFHNWLVPVSVVISLGTVVKETGQLIFIAYFSLLGVFYLLGNSDFFSRQKSTNNGFQALGSLGTIVLLLALSFNWFWEDIRRENFPFTEILVAPEFIAAAALSVLAGSLLYRHQRSKHFSDINPIAFIFILFIATFVIGLYSPIAVVLVNLYVLAIGILTIRNGIRHNHLGILNYGLLMLTALVVCRFFDTDLSFIIRGVLFVLVGIGFFGANYQMLTKRKTHEQ
jgi:hypothetical protein